MPVRRLLAVAVAVLLAAGLAVGTAAGPARAATCTVSGDTDTAPNDCGPYGYPQISGINGDVTTANGVWSNPAGFTNQTCTPGPNPCQTLTSTNPGSWYVAAVWPAGNTSVESFPATGVMVPWLPGTSRNPALSSWSSMTSTFSENFRRYSNPGTVAEAAYDIWLNDWANEVMIQTDFVGDSQRERCDTAGDVIATQAFGGTGGVPVHTWDLCQFGDELIWQLPTGTNMASGSVDVMAMLTWLETHGRGKYLPAASTLTDAAFGFEICSTGGQGEAFPLTGFTLTAVPKM